MLTQVLRQLGRSDGADGDGTDADDAETGELGTADDIGTAGAVPAGVLYTGTRGAPGTLGMGAIGTGALDLGGAIHLVQTVEVEVLVIVEIVFVICRVGVPVGGVMVLVTGQVVKVVRTL